MCLNFCMKFIIWFVWFLIRFDPFSRSPIELGLGWQFFWPFRSGLFWPKLFNPKPIKISPKSLKLTRLTTLWKPLKFGNQSTKTKGGKSLVLISFHCLGKTLKVTLISLEMVEDYWSKKWWVIDSAIKENYFNYE